MVLLRLTVVVSELWCWCLVYRCLPRQRRIDGEPSAWSVPFGMPFDFSHWGWGGSELKEKAEPDTPARRSRLPHWFPGLLSSHLWNVRIESHGRV